MRRIASTRSFAPFAKYPLPNRHAFVLLCHCVHCALLPGTPPAATTVQPPHIGAPSVVSVKSVSSAVPGLSSNPIVLTLSSRSRFASAARLSPALDHHVVQLIDPRASDGTPVTATPRPTEMTRTFASVTTDDSPWKRCFFEIQCETKTGSTGAVCEFVFGKPSVIETM